MSSFESRNGFNNGTNFPSGGGLHINPNNNRPPTKPRTIAPTYPMYHGHVPPQPARAAPTTMASPLGTSLINKTAPPTASLLVDRRVEHMEENMKRLKDQVDSINAMIKERKLDNEMDAAVSSWMNATATQDTTEYVTLEDDIATLVAHMKPTHVEEGTTLSVAYPMHKVRIDDNIAIVMRRRIVDRDTAQISGSWVVVNKPGNDNGALVSDFTF